MPKEAQARIKINARLQEAGWRFFDDENGPANISLETNVKITERDIDALGEDFEKTKNGFVDFLLLDRKGFPLAVLEAKSEDKDPLVAKEQARNYAISQNARFIILSNGNIHYFWDLERGNPSVISTLPTPDSLGQFREFKPNPEKLASELVEEDYIVLTQQPGYAQEPRWMVKETRADYLNERQLKILRDYQLHAVHALQAEAKKGNDRYLFEMATGTGKTLVAGAVVKLFLRTGNARRVLFLVDRLELEDQAWKNFVRYFKNDYTTVIYKENRDDWRKADIVVSTVQSLSFNNKYKKLFSPTDFDLLISDEAHRSINGNARAVFEYFVGYKLGLTATPKDYLKNLDPERVGQSDPRQWERRQLLDTYKTFGCESGIPTFRYSLNEGVADEYLVNPIVADARTEITTELLSEKGYSVVDINEEGIEEESIFRHTDFERKFFSKKTNLIFCKTFLEKALKDPISGEIGKTIIFCVSQKHASKITQVLNEFAHAQWPGKYQSDFAVQVTSNVSDSQQFSIKFTNNNLNGQSRFLEGYRSSRTRVCVTVGMMTTGYDCQDVLNLCLMRPIFSPTDFIQIKGRGTRRYTFSHSEGRGTEREEMKVEKTCYKLFDFFANCEYFEEKFNYDEVIELPPISDGGGGGGGGTHAGEVTVAIPDPLKTFNEVAIGLEGMKVDRKLFERFEETVKTDPFIAEHYADGATAMVEDYVKTNLFNKPEDYVDLQKLRKALNADRRLSVHEVLDLIFGATPKIKSRNELLEEEVEKFVTIYKPESKYVPPIKNFLTAYITDAEIRDIMDKKEYGRFATNPRVSLDDFGALGKWRDVIPEYVKDYVKINTYM